MSDEQWIVCVHVAQRRASEVWCRPDRIAVCPDCAIVGNIIHPSLKPQLVRIPHREPVSEERVAALVAAVAVIKGREHLPLPCAALPAPPSATGSNRTKRHRCCGKTFP